MFTRESSSDNPDTRGRVLAAARKLMDERGVARLRVDAVAKDAGLSAGALYRHFTGREELILAVILESVPRDMPTTAASMSEDEAQASLPTLIDQIYEHEKRMAAVAITVLADEKLSAGFRDTLSRAHGGPQDFTRALAAALRSYVDGGALRADLDVDTAATFVQGRCFHHAVLDRLHGPSEALGAPSAVTAEIVNFLKARPARVP